MGEAGPVNARNAPTEPSLPLLPGLLLLPQFVEARELGFPLYGPLFRAAAIAAPREVSLA